MTLNNQCLRLGRVAASGLIDDDEVLTTALEAGHAMARNSDPRKKPWGRDEVEQKVRRAFQHGFAMGPPDDLRWDRPDRRRLIHDRRQERQRSPR